MSSKKHYAFYNYFRGLTRRDNKDQDDVLNIYHGNDESTSTKNIKSKTEFSDRFDKLIPSKSSEPNRNSSEAMRSSKSN